MKFQYEKERIFSEDETGRVIAEITFPTKDRLADITHTFVDDSLRGQGAAAQLLSAAAAQIRSEGLKAKATCSYAAKWFEKHPEEEDLLV